MSDVQDCVRQYFGKYRGTVLDNIDPDRMGRILPEVPSVPGMLLNWAMPCFPYAGREVGFFAIPPIGATVWVEFEGGNPTYPIWSGCYWDSPAEVPPLALAGMPLVKGMITDFITMLWNDTPEEGGFLLELVEPVSPGTTTIFCGETGVSILVPPAEISIMPAEVTVELPPATLSVTEALVSVDLPDSLVEISEAGITVTAPELNVTANVMVEGAVEIEGDVDITGAVDVAGDVEIAGAVEMEGVVTIIGALTVEA